MIDAAARAEQMTGHRTFGIAVSGSTAQRLGQDSPALAGQTLTLDALVARVDRGQLQIGEATTIYFDEAGVGDTDRFDRLTEAVAERGAKLVAISEVALISDASNKEIHRLNARAQHYRAERGELGDLEVQVPGVHYGIRAGDRIAMIDQHHEPGVERIENGARGEVLDINDAGEVLVQFDMTGQWRTPSGDDLARLRLGYAQHIHRAQGATVTRTLVVTGGWQTSKEPAYVEASRARQGTDSYVARQDLGTEGHDTDRIKRLAQSMSRSDAQTPSLAYPEYGPGFQRTIAPSRSQLGIARAIYRIAQPQPTREPPATRFR